MKTGRLVAILCLLGVFLWLFACEGAGTPGDEINSSPDASEPTTQTEPAMTEPSLREPTPDQPVQKETPPESAGLTACQILKRDIGGLAPDYSSLNAKIGSHCFGTNHQDIKDVELLVFVGDSVTRGTPPTPVEKYFREQMGVRLKAKFPGLEIRDCSKWGAKMDDLLTGDKQLTSCIKEEVVNKRTLIVMTMGGNDMQSIAKKSIGGETLEQGMKRADDALKHFQDAMTWSKDAKRFPKGSYVVFANVYEFTDSTGDVTACPVSQAVGFTAPWKDGAQVFAHFNKKLLTIAVSMQIDMMFMFEHFCGHGFFNEDPQNACYLGPDTPRWFDGTCTHPNPDGHTRIADMFMATINE